MGSLEKVPFWHVNVPECERTADCPEFLRSLSQKDMRALSTPDACYEMLTWVDVARIVSSNSLERFQRIPSQLRRYRKFTYQTTQRYGTVADFVLRERLRWVPPVCPRGRPFEYDDDDVKILFNDWPYGLDPRIVHLVVWTKFELLSDDETGDLTHQARAEIEAHVTKTFRSRMPEGHVIWFRNWAALKSVHAVEHYHVMLFDPDPDFIREVTNGDIAQCNKVMV